MIRCSSITVPTVAFSVVSNAALAATSMVCVACPTARREIDARRLLHLEQTFAFHRG